MKEPFARLPPGPARLRRPPDVHERTEAILRPLVEADWIQVAAVYEEGIATKLATFETAAPAWPDWDAAHRAAHRLVAEQGREVVGFAALSPVSSRCVYEGVAEESVYVAERARGRGVGRALLEAIVAGSERDGIWTLQAGIFPENRASLALHHACGFRTVGIRERIGRLDGAWRDVVLLERRSEEVG
jgi:L-amino acid N-acyltransferase YncA